METSDWIALTNVLVTAGFSFLVWRATVKTADVAKATLELNEKLSKSEKIKEEEYRKIMRSHYINDILIKSQKIYDAFATIDEKKLFSDLRDTLPEDINVDVIELAKYFNKTEVDLIINTWDIYKSYRNQYFKVGYRGNEMGILTEKAPMVIDKFYLLLAELEKQK